MLLFLNYYLVYQDLGQVKFLSVIGIFLVGIEFSSSPMVTFLLYY